MTPPRQNTKRRHGTDIDSVDQKAAHTHACL
jgi:hypothetical protein